MKVILIVLTLVFVLFAEDRLLSQTIQDSIAITGTKSKEKKGSIFSGRPGKAMLMSLVIPGAGQIYNRSYLRVPFVWGAVGGMGLVVLHNTQQYNCYRDAYIHLIDGTTYDPPSYCYERILEITDPGTVRLIRDKANKDRQASIGGFALVWLLNGVDAFVDAHLKDFDIKEDLSVEIGTRLEDDPFAPMRMGIYVQF